MYFYRDKKELSCKIILKQQKKISFFFLTFNVTHEQQR